MKPVLVFGMIAVAPLVAHANDSSFDGMGGSPHPTRGENKAIRMVSEKVVLTANTNDFSTQADFIFKNETASAQNVAMGFPELNTGEDDESVAAKKTPFLKFATFVDGRQMLARRTTLNKTDASGFNTYWMKTVSFAPRQTRRVRVQFRSYYGGTTGWGTNRVLSYSFTGANWRGNVAESVLEVRVAQPGLWRVAGFVSQFAKPLSLSLTSGKDSATFRHVWKNWQAQEDVFIALERSIPFWRKDMALHTDNPQVLKTVAATQTVRVGPKPQGLEPCQGLPPDAFAYNNIMYVGVNYLADKLGSWDAANVAINFNPATGFDLRGGKTRIQGKVGESSLRINGNTVATGAPIIQIKNSGYNSVTYVPLAPLTRALGWKLTLKGERLFSLDRGSWRG